MHTQPETLSQKVAAFLKEKRQASEMSMADLANAAFKNSNRKSYICAIENGKRDITLQTLKSLLSTLKSDLVFTSRAGSIVAGCNQENAIEFIKQERLNLGLSQARFSTLVYGDESSKGNISKIEAGKKKLTLITLGYILKALNSDISFVE